MALTCARGSRAVPHTTAYDAVDDAVHDTFMTLPPYTRIKEGKVHELGRGVRNCSRSARSDPLSKPSGSIEWEGPATSAEGAGSTRILWVWGCNLTCKSIGLMQEQHSSKKEG